MEFIDELCTPHLHYCQQRYPIFLKQFHNMNTGAEGWYRAGSEQLPGIATVRGLVEEGPGSNRAAVLEVSARLMQLRDLLGGRDDIDIVHMLVREPR